MYVLSNTHIYLYICISETVFTNVNNYVVFVPHVPIYWSERINKVEVEGYFQRRPVTHTSSAHVGTQNFKQKKNN